MSDFYASSDLSRIRRLHVGEESYADQRKRERQQAKQTEKESAAKQQTLQQTQDLAAQRSRQWSE